MLNKSIVLYRLGVGDSPHLALPPSEPWQKLDIKTLTIKHPPMVLYRHNAASDCTYQSNSIHHPKKLKKTVNNLNNQLRSNPQQLQYR